MHEMLHFIQTVNLVSMESQNLPNKDEASYSKQIKS